MAKRRSLELYEVLQRQASQKPTRSRVRDFVPLADESGPEDPVILPAQSRPEPPPADDLILPPPVESTAAPDRPHPAPAAAADLEQQVFSRAVTLTPSERGVIVTARYNALIVAGAAAAILLMGVFVLGRATAPSPTSPQAASSQDQDPLAEARENAAGYHQVGTTPPADGRRSPAAGQRQSLPPAVQGTYWEVLLESYPASKRVMAQRAKQVLENAGFAGVRTRPRSDGKVFGLWSPPFRSEQEAKSFRQRVKQVGARLNGQYNLGSDFADPVIRKRS